MGTHSICDDPGTTDDCGSWGGQLRSKVTIHFLPIARDMMEIEKYKWCQTTWLVIPLWKTCIMTYLGHVLSWGQILKLSFLDQKVHVSDWLDEASMIMSLSFSYLSYQKVFNKKTISDFFHLMISGAKAIDLMSNLIENLIGARREESYRAMTIAFFEFFLAVIL